MEKFILQPKICHIIASVNILYSEGNEHFNQNDDCLGFFTIFVSPLFSDPAGSGGVP